MENIDKRIIKKSF